jgi:hypothetical protein
MPSEKDKGGRREFEVAYFTKELGRPLQRQLLRQRLAEFSDSSIQVSHGDDLEPETQDAPPRDDRAG